MYFYFKFELFSLFHSELWWCHCWIHENHHCMCPRCSFPVQLNPCVQNPVQDGFNHNLYTGLSETLAPLLSSHQWGQARPLHMLSSTCQNKSELLHWKLWQRKGDRNKYNMGESALPVWTWKVTPVNTLIRILNNNVTFLIISDYLPLNYLFSFLLKIILVVYLTHYVNLLAWSKKKTKIYQGHLWYLYSHYFISKLSKWNAVMQ